MTVHTDSFVMLSLTRCCLLLSLLLPLAAAAQTGTQDLAETGAQTGRDALLRIPGDIRDISSGEAGPPLNAPALAVVVAPDGTVYAGGGFLSAGSTVLNRIARRRGMVWEPLGSGMDGNVGALALAQDGTLYAAGGFTTAGGVAALHVAKWTGDRWEALGSGIPENVRTLAVAADGSVFAGGAFITAGGVSANNVARWTGGAWEALGQGIGGSNNGESVFTLIASPDGSVYAGGNFSFAGGGSARNVARWAAGGWTSLGAGIIDSVRRMAIAPDGSVYVGDFRSGTEVSRWDGRVWSPFGQRLTTPPLDLAVTPDGTVYAGVGYRSNVPLVGGDYPYILRWSGTAWEPLPAGQGIDREPFFLYAAPDNSVYTSGYLSRAGSTSASAIARWSGTAWTSLGGGMNGTIEDLARTPDAAVYAIGNFGTAGGVAAQKVARWTGTAWQSLGGNGLPESVDTIQNLVTGADGSVYASAYFYGSASVPAGSYVIRWTGTEWVRLGAAFDSAVFALAVGPDGALYAGGIFQSAGGVPAVRVARWRDGAWTPLGTGIGNRPQIDRVTRLAVSEDGSVFASGTFAVAGGTPARNIARWDGARWIAQGNGVSTEFLSVLRAAPDGSVYASGSFYEIGGVAARGVARWTTAGWAPLSSAPGYDYLSALTFAPDGTVYAVGEFGSLPGSGSSHLVRLTGSGWESLGRNSDGTVHAMAFDRHGDLVLGGNFRTVGGVFSPYAVLYDVSGTVASEGVAETRVELALEVSPNPVASGGTERVVTAEAGPVRAALFDVLGRQVAVLVDGAWSAGEHTVGLGAERLVPGVYVVRVTAGASSAVRRVTVAR